MPLEIERKFLVRGDDWRGDEVTDDPRYRNASLARRPFRTWRDAA